MRKDYFFISGLITFGIYISFFIMLFFYLREHEVKKFDASKKLTVLELEVVQPQKEVTKEVQVQKTETKTQQKEDVVEKSASVNLKPKSDLKQLFANVSTKSEVVKKEETTNVEKSSVMSRFKAKFEKEKKSENLDVSNILKKVETKSNLAIATTSENVDEYYSKIYDIISQRWNPMSIENGLASKVIITIDNKGNFSFRIITRAGDEKFDSSLEDFLNSQENESYPPYEKGSSTNIEFTFKTKDE